MSIKKMEIHFPAVGVQRRAGLRATTDSRAPYPAPWGTNVRLEDSLTNRMRGGSFTAQASNGSKASPVYRDRAITFSSNAITAARQGSSSDTTLSSDVSDTRRPILFQLSEAGSVGSTVVAVVPHKDLYMLCFTATETWVLQGDPATGSLRRVSDQLGTIGAYAYCVAHDVVYFMSSRGLYAVGADGSSLTPISEDVIPSELTGVSDDTTVLDYNHADRGVYIHIPAATVSWFYDSARQGFWPFDRGTSESHILCGPFRLGMQNSFGRLLNLQGTLATGSNDVYWRIVTGDTAETCAANGKAAIEADILGNDYSSYVHSSGTWSAGRSNMSYPRTRAVFCCLWLSSAGTWAYEAASVEAIISGKWR